MIKKIMSPNFLALPLLRPVQFLPLRSWALVTCMAGMFNLEVRQSARRLTFGRELERSSVIKSTETIKELS